MLTWDKVSYGFDNDQDSYYSSQVSHLLTHFSDETPKG